MLILPVYALPAPREREREIESEEVVLTCRYQISDAAYIQALLCSLSSHALGFMSSGRQIHDDAVPSMHPDVCVRV